LNFVDTLKRELQRRNIPYKENETNLIIKCPVCYHRDNKEKIKLYIHKELGIYHCFRCETKGSIFGLVKLLDKYYNIDLSDVLDISILLDKQFSANLSSKSLSELLKNISKGDEEYKERLRKSLLKEAKDTIISLKKSQLQSGDVYSYYGYIQKRGIPVSIFKMTIPHSICNNPNSELYTRIAFPSLFFTNYEARTIISGIEPRYKQKQNTKHSDLIGYFTKINQISFYHSGFRKYESEKLEMEDVYVVEGVFDALKLRILGKKNVISLGGWGKGKKLLLFLKHLSLFFKDFKIHNLKVILDNDVNLEQFEKVVSFFSYYKNSISDIVEEIKIAKFEYENRKDIGALSSTEELMKALSVQKYFTL
jgi:hypothetical protein